MIDTTETMASISRLTRDLAAATTTMTDDEARFLVDAYYMMQDQRIRTDNQVRALSGDAEPHAVLAWLAGQSDTLENQVKRALTKFAQSHRFGAWPMAQVGIGPVITAGLLAHLDINRAPVAGHFWNFAGLNPGIAWEKGQKRPFNAALKTLCWKIGESFVKVSGREDAFYGQIYAAKKVSEIEKNEAGLFADQAAAKLERFKIGKTTDAYKAYSIGKLPPAHIHARAKRYAVKLFLSHLHETMYEIEYGTTPPLPYAMAHLGHAHKIEVPR
jgi:hypothetical protein